MILAVDIDEVVADTLPAFLLHYNQKFHSTITPHDFLTSDWGEQLNLSPALLDREIGNFIRGEFYNSLTPVSDAFAVLNILKSNHTLRVITSRWGELEKTTMQWLQTHLPNVFDAVHFSRTSHANVLQEDSKRKSEVCRSIGASLIIEDCPKHAADCASNGIKVLLYDRPWNKGFERDGVTRVDSWRAILEQSQMIQ